MSKNTRKNRGSPHQSIMEEPELEGSIKIIESNSWPCTGHSHKSQQGSNVGRNPGLVPSQWSRVSPMGTGVPGRHPALPCPGGSCCKQQPSEPNTRAAEADNVEAQAVTARSGLSLHCHHRYKHSNWVPRLMYVQGKYF